MPVALIIEQYKDLEGMAYELRADLPKLASTAHVLTVDKHDTISRRRGSSSPFRCVSSLLQQANMEKDEELSATRLRLGELEALTSSQQEEVKYLPIVVLGLFILTQPILTFEDHSKKN